MCLKSYQLDLYKYILAPGLAWETALKNEINLELLTEIDMLLMLEKGINTFHPYAKANKKYMKDYDKNEE